LVFGTVQLVQRVLLTSSLLLQTNSSCVILIVLLLAFKIRVLFLAFVILSIVLVSLSSIFGQAFFPILLVSLHYSFKPSIYILQAICQIILFFLKYFQFLTKRWSILILQCSALSVGILRWCHNFLKSNFMSINELFIFLTDFFITCLVTRWLIWHKSFRWIAVSKHHN